MTTPDSEGRRAKRNSGTGGLRGRSPQRIARLLPVALVLLVNPAAAAIDPSVKCQVAKLKAVAKKVLKEMKCHQNALLKAVPVDSACLDAAQSTFVSAIAKADALDVCAGDAVSLEAAVDACVETYLTVVTDSSTTTTVAPTTTTTMGGACPAGQTLCGTNCVDTETDPNNCGTCGNDCNAACTGNVAATVCSTGICTIVSCSASHYNVDGSCGNGCECTGIGSVGSCESGTNLGTVQPGQAISRTANTPQGGTIWYQVTFTSGGTPRIRFTSNPFSAFRFDVVASCMFPVSCLGGGTDCFPGAGTFQVGVSPVTSAPGCNSYSLTFTN